MSGRKKLRIIGIAVLVVAAGIAASLYFTRNDVAKADVGDCVKINKASETDADVDTIDCGDNAAALKVAKKFDVSDADCPTNDYPSITKRGGGGPEFTLCLIPNVKEGDCANGLESADKFVRADCSGAEFKFVKVVDGNADEAACGADSFPLVYPEPPTTFCLAQP
jgi:hypothetical protein